MLGIEYDPSKIDKNVEENQKLRRAEKDKKVLIEKYINFIQDEIKAKEYVDQGVVPKIEDLETQLKVSKERAKHIRTIIRTQVMENKKPELMSIGKIPTQEKINELFGKDKHANDQTYIDDVENQIIQKFVDNNQNLRYVL